MRDFSDSNAWRTAGEKRGRFLGVELSSWNTFLFGIAIGFATIYFGVTQPTVRELAELRDQVQSLERTVRDVADHRDSVKHTNGLLTLLEEQGRTAASAAASLERISTLHRRMQQQAEQIDQATAALDNLTQLKDSVLRGAASVREAAAVLPMITWVNDRLIGEQVQAAQAQDSLAALEQLRDSLVARSSGVDSARISLDKMIAMKDAVIARTGDLAAATDTLDLIADVQQQLSQAAQAVGRMRHWAVEILAFEPTLNREMRVLQPLTDLGNLRHLDRDELRHVVRSLNGQRKELVADTEVEQKPATTKAPVEDVPTVAERAPAE